MTILTPAEYNEIEQLAATDEGLQDLLTKLQTYYYLKRPPRKVEIPVMQTFTHQNVTASRTVGATYTNTHGKPLIISAHIVNSKSCSSDTAKLIVNGSVIGAAHIHSNSSADLRGMIPPGSVYSITTDSSLAAWWVESF